METADYISRLRVVGGDPAVDFVNTMDGAPDEPPESEAIRSFADLVAWGVHVGLLPEPSADRLQAEARRRPTDAESAYARALRLRAALYDVLLHLARREAPPGAALDAVREIALDGLERAVLEWSDGTFGWAWPDDGDLDRVTWAMAHAATELLTSPRLERLKLCAGCRWVFIDASKNHSRRWCHMDECGTHEKVRRYVARRAAARESTPR